MATKQTKPTQMLFNTNTRSFWNEIRNSNKNGNTTSNMIYDRLGDTNKQDTNSSPTLLYFL